jgi:hypothetical protein
MSSSLCLSLNEDPIGYRYVETGPFLGVGVMPLSLGRVIFCFFTEWFAGRPDIGRTIHLLKAICLD